MGFRKLSDKYEFDILFYIAVLGLAALIVGVPWYVKKSYDRSRGAEVQALLDRENFNTIDAFRKQAKNWVNNRTYGHKLTKDEREAAEEIMAQGLFKYVNIWTDDRMKSVATEETDKKQKLIMSTTLAELDTYLDKIGKRRK